MVAAMATDSAFSMIDFGASLNAARFHQLCRKATGDRVRGFHARARKRYRGQNACMKPNSYIRVVIIFARQSFRKMPKPRTRTRYSRLIMGQTLISAFINVEDITAISHHVARSWLISE